MRTWLHGWRALLLVALALAVSLQLVVPRLRDGGRAPADADAARSLLPSDAEIVGEESTGCVKFGPGCFTTYFALPGRSVEVRATAVKDAAATNGWTLAGSREGEGGTLLTFARGDLEAEVVLWRDPARRCREHVLRECNTTVDNIDVGPRLSR